MKRTKEENIELCKRYPFLIPRNRWTGEIARDYDYSYTEIDALGEGWFKAFGLQICEEIRNALIEANYLDKYRIIDIKEKYGSLRWYDAGAPEKVYKIIRKYEKLSEEVCYNCGKPSVGYTPGWILFLCEDCGKKENAFVRFDEENNEDEKEN